MSQQPAASSQMLLVRLHSTSLFPMAWEESGLQSGSSTWVVDVVSVFFTHLTVPRGEAENWASAGNLGVVLGSPWD